MGKYFGGCSAVVVFVGGLIVILQFLGVTHLQDLFNHPTPTPPPPQVIAESSYNSVSPGCDASKDPSDITWRITSATNTCQPNDGGTNLIETNLQYVPGLLFEAADSMTLASNQTISADFSNVGSSTCAGLETRINLKTAASYAFYYCGDGDWYIMEYSSSGTPVVLNQGKPGTQGNSTGAYTLVITVENNNLQMTVNGQTYTAQNSDYTLTDAAGIVMSDESVITTYQAAQAPVSITVSNFHYQAG